MGDCGLADRALALPRNLLTRDHRRRRSAGTGAAAQPGTEWSDRPSRGERGFYSVGCERAAGDRGAKPDRILKRYHAASESVRACRRAAVGELEAILAALGVRPALPVVCGARQPISLSGLPPGDRKQAVIAVPLSARATTNSTGACSLASPIAAAPRRCSKPSVVMAGR